MVYLQSEIMVFTACSIHRFVLQGSVGLLRQGCQQARSQRYATYHIYQNIYHISASLAEDYGLEIIVAESALGTFAEQCFQSCPGCQLEVTHYSLVSRFQLGM